MKLGFAGGAMEVGGSCIYLRTGNAGILLDAGVRQAADRDPIPDFRMIQNMGGVDAITALLRGQTNAATSPVTKLAGNLFKTNILKNLNLGTSTNNSLMGLIPMVMSKLSNVVRDRDGDGDVDLNDIILSLKSSGSGAGAGVLGAATSILGGIFGRRKK